MKSVRMFAATIAAIAIIVIGFATAAAVTTPPLAVSSFKSSYLGGDTASFTIRLAEAAPAGGRAVALKSSSSYLVLPSRVVIPKGGKAISLRVPVSAVPSNKSVTITASFGSNKATFKMVINAPSISKITLVTDIATGKSGSGSINLDSAAYKDTVVTLKSSNSRLTVDAKVTIPKGQKTGRFSVLAEAVSKNTLVTVTAKLSTKTATATITVHSPEIITLSLENKNVEGGYSGTLYITLTAPAPAQGVKVSLSSLSSRLQIPATVTIPKGMIKFSVDFDTTKTNTSLSVPITADQGSIRKTVAVTLLRPQAHPDRVEIDSPYMIYGFETTATLYLTKAAEGAKVFKIVNSDPFNVSMPVSVRVGDGAESADFTIKIRKPVTQDIYITVSDAAGEIQATFAVKANVLTYSDIPDDIDAGTTASGEAAMINPAPRNSGDAVHVTSSDPDVLAPSSEWALISTTEPFASFSLIAAPVFEDHDVTITLTYGDDVLEEVVHVVAIESGLLDSITLPAEAMEAGTHTVTLHLSRPVPDNGLTITLQSTDPGVISMPETVVVNPGDGTEISITVTVVQPDSDTVVTLIALVGPENVSVDTTILGPVQPTETPTAIPTDEPTSTPTEEPTATPTDTP